MISCIQLQYNNGHNHYQTTHNLEGGHDFAQKSSSNNPRRYRFECCGNAGMRRLYPFDSFEIEPKWENGTANANVVLI
jgi:hypothetical protein